VDTKARVLDRDARPLDGLLAAGADAGGIAVGGYASGLAAALVLGLTAAETAVGR
jgi:predicted oxidoreductase